MSEPVQASKRFHGLLPKGIVAFETDASVSLESLHPEESRAITRAAPKRAAEFAAGRACARRALAEFGITHFALRAGTEREPLWPPHMTGSITHTAGFCAAAAARRTSCDALGIDAERRGAVHRRLWRQIATGVELDWLTSLAPSEATDRATILFSAKESFFKCQFPLTREWLSFSDVKVSINPSYFAVEPCRTLALESRTAPPWRGRYAVEDNLILTAICLRPEGLASGAAS